MEQNNQQQNNVFLARLTEYIITHHPEKIDDVEFINERAEIAATTFETASFNGLTVEEAMQTANKALFKGLVFSPFITVKDIVLECTDYNEEDEELDEFVLQMLDITQQAFDKRDINDEFQGTIEYLELCTEVKEIINQYLIKNGIQ